MRRLRCWWGRHELTDHVEVLTHWVGDRGQGIIVRRTCKCGRHVGTGMATEPVA